MSSLLLLMDPAFLFLVTSILFFGFILAVAETVTDAKQSIPVNLEVGILLPYPVNGCGNS